MKSYTRAIFAWESERLRAFEPAMVRIHAELLQRVLYAAWPLDPGPLDQVDRANDTRNER